MKKMFESLSQNFGILRQPVGNNLKNEEDDVLAVKRRLADMGRLTLDPRKGEPHGYITREMDQGIRRFQTERGLKVDGVMFPGGETERVLASERSAPQAQALPQAAEEKKTYDIDIGKGSAYTQLWKQYRTPRKEEQKDAGGAGEYSVKTVDPAFIDKFYRKEMEDNNRRFIDSMVKGYVDKNPKQSSPLKTQILNLRDGESVTLKKDGSSKVTDHWDQDVSRVKSFVKSLDEGLGFGAAKINSVGTLKATRRGDTVEIEGVIDHNLSDIYDFNVDTAFDRAAFVYPRSLDQKGKAKPFLSQGTRIHKLKGSLRVKNGQIYENGFRWQDVH